MMRREAERIVGKVRVAKAIRPYTDALFVARVSEENLAAHVTELNCSGYDIAVAGGRALLLIPTRRAMLEYTDHVVELCGSEKLLEGCVYEHARLLCECARMNAHRPGEPSVQAFSLWVQGLRRLYTSSGSVQIIEYERNLRGQASLSLRTGKGTAEVLASACCLVELSNSYSRSLGASRDN